MFNQYIGAWDVSNVTSMSGMFSHAYLFNQDVGGWDVSNVTSMVNMFEYAYAFNQDLSDWSTSSMSWVDYQGFSRGVTNWTMPEPSWGSCP